MRKLKYSIVCMLVLNFLAIGQVNAQTYPNNEIRIKSNGTISSADNNNNNNMSCDSTCVMPTPSSLTIIKATTTTSIPNPIVVPPNVLATCGSSNASLLPEMPTSFLCGVGTPSSVSTTISNEIETIYNWDCTSTSGNVASCEAEKRTVGVCGPSHLRTFTSFPTQLCSEGYSTELTRTGLLYRWECQGNYGPVESCGAYYLPPPSAMCLLDFSGIIGPCPYTIPPSPFCAALGFEISWITSDPIEQCGMAPPTLDFGA